MFDPLSRRDLLKAVAAGALLSALPATASAGPLRKIKYEKGDGGGIAMLLVPAAIIAVCCGGPVLLAHHHLALACAGAPVDLLDVIAGLVLPHREEVTAGAGRCAGLGPGHQTGGGAGGQALQRFDRRGDNQAAPAPRPVRAPSRRSRTSWPRSCGPLTPGIRG